VGLQYVEMDPFSVAVGRDGAIVRFHRSVERTVASIAENSPADADRYRAWMHDAMPLVRVLSAGLGGSGRGAWRRAPGLALAAGRALRRNGGPVGVAELLASPYRSVLEQRLATDRVLGPVAAFAAHASASPAATGSALFGLWQASYHQVGQWHEQGGSQALADALARRLAGYGATPVPVHRSSASCAGGTRCPASPWPTDRRCRPVSWSPPSTPRLHCSSSSTRP
jgi:phytoene dehydrogenase-like protein